MNGKDGRTFLTALIAVLIAVVILAYAYRGSHVTETTNLPGTGTTPSPAPQSSPDQPK